MNTATQPISKADADALAAHVSPLRDFWRSFSANKGAIGGLVIVCAVLLLAAFANQIAAVINKSSKEEPRTTPMVAA